MLGSRHVVMYVSRLWNMDDTTLKMIIFHYAAVFCRVCLVMFVTVVFIIVFSVRPAVGEKGKRTRSMRVSIWSTIVSDLCLWPWGGGLVDGL